MKKPNFLIVGAPKAGTTSIAKYLGEHPEIFISKEKEPFYFLSKTVNNLPKDDPMHRVIKKKFHGTPKEYYSLFDNVHCEKKIGEATVHYLFHYKEVIPRVKEELGDIPIIIVLRNPSNRAYSNFNYQLGNGAEKPGTTFEEGLKLEEQRKSKCFNSFWYYKEVGKYYLPVKSYLDNFSKVYVCTFEDFKKEPTEFIQGMFKFLNVDKDFIPNFEIKYNPTIKPKNYLFQWLFFLKIKYNLRLGLPLVIKNRLAKRIFEPYESTINSNTLEYLQKYYETDIKKLEALLSRDFTIWFKK